METKTSRSIDPTLFHFEFSIPYITTSQNTFFLLDPMESVNLRIVCIPMPRFHVVFLFLLRGEHLVTDVAPDLSPPDVKMFPSDMFNQVASPTKTFAALHARDILHLHVDSLHMPFYVTSSLCDIRAVPTWKLPRHAEVCCPYVIS